MAGFRRRPKLDPDVQATIKAADPDERVLAWGTVPGERVIVATTRGLWWPMAAGGEAAMRRIPWERVDKAAWRDGALVVTEADVVDDLLLIDRDPVGLPMAEPGQVPAEVKRRVEANVVSSEIVPVTGGQARVVGRRVPGRDGLTWWARLEGSTPDNAITREQVEQAIDRARAAEAARTPQF